MQRHWSACSATLEVPIRAYRLCMFTLLKRSLSQSSSAVDNATPAPSSPDSTLGTTLWEASQKNLSVKRGSPDTLTVSISGKFCPSSSSLHAALLYSSWIIGPHFYLPYVSFSCLGSVRNSHCSQATLLLCLLIYL